MSDSGGLPRNVLDVFAKDLRTKRWFERLQQQAMVLLPDQITAINAAIEDTQSLADDAFTLAHAANTRPIDSVELLPLFVRPIDDAELLPLFVHTHDDRELLPIPVKPPETTGGWARYSDTVYTQASPFTVAEGVESNMPNNAGSALRSFLPLGVGDFYDGTKITPDIAGDYCIITIRFMASCTKSVGYGALSIDIGGAEGKIFPHLMVFPKGAGVFHPFDIPIPCFMLDTFKANGGIVKLDAQLGDISVASISYQIARVSTP